jgi:hypothetical protein
MGYDDAVRKVHAAQMELTFLAAPRPVSRTKVLVDAIRAALGDVRVELGDARSTLVSQATAKDGARVVRVHQLFLDAPDDVRAALARWLSRGDKAAGRVIDDFVDAREHLLGVAAPLPRDAHVGAHHDLAAIFVDVNERYFAKPVDAEIGWGGVGHVRRRGRSSITFGTYDERLRRILIHPCLDQAHVPRLCVARVVHHEMLHAKHPQVRGDDGRRVVHGPAFRRDEAQFEGAPEADRWFDAHLDALLRFKGP